MLDMPRRTLLAFIGLGAATRAAWAQEAFPGRPVRIVVPFGPGGGTDNLIRLLDPQVARRLGQPLVIENRAGAASVVGTEVIARAEPDGYSLLATDSTFTINPGLFPSLPYDSARGFAPICLLATAPVVLLAHPSLAARSVAELLAMARERPGALAYASGGNGSPTHLAGEMLKAEARLQLTHLPYRGTGPAMNDLVAGHVPLGFNGLSAARPFILDGRVQALAVTGTARSAAFPDVPTFAESGLPGVDIVTHWGVLTRAGAPQAAITRLGEAFGQAVRTAELQPRLRNLGYVPDGGGPAAYAEVIAAQTARFAEVIRAAGIRPD
jgi:tripartite-type tricarboxylate transporter receptor subunit TctC